MHVNNIQGVFFTCILNNLNVVMGLQTPSDTPVLHFFMYVSTFVAIGAGLATMSPTFKEKADALVKRFFDLFN